MEIWAMSISCQKCKYLPMDDLFTATNIRKLCQKLKLSPFIVVALKQDRVMT